MRRPGRLLQDRVAFDRRSLPSRPRARARLQARASRAGHTCGLLVRGQEGEAARRASAVSHAVRFRHGLLVDREPWLRAVRPEPRALSERSDAGSVRQAAAGVGVRADEIGGSDTRHQLYGTTIEGTPGSLWRWWLGVTRNEEGHASQVRSATKAAGASLS